MDLMLSYNFKLVSVETVKFGELVLLACSGSVVAVGSLVYLCLGSQAHRADCSNDGPLQLPLGVGWTTAVGGVNWREVDSRDFDGYS